MDHDLFNELKEGIGALGTIRKQKKEIEELSNKLKAWQECADNLVDYAHEFVANLSAWGKGYDRYDKDIKQAEDAIEEFKRLKNGN